VYELLAPADNALRSLPAVAHGHRAGLPWRFCIVTHDGDGTVPVDLTVLNGTDSYVVDGMHSELPNDSRVVNAVVELLTRGETRLLARSWRPRSGPAQVISEREFCSDDSSKRSWRRMSLRERRHILGGVVFPH
jgi:hypothetical protein